MSDYQDPPLRLAITGLRWLGEDWKPLGEQPARFDIYGTDQSEDAATVLRCLRRMAAQRLDMHLLALAAGRQDLDFNAPNAPTEDDMRELLGHAEHIVDTLRALVELAPELIGDDDDE